MGTAERRLEMMKYICNKRHVKMKYLAEMFGVSLKTIQRDILELEEVFRLPIVVRSGRYGGGIYVVGDYSYDKIYMSDEELSLLFKIKDSFGEDMSERDMSLLIRIISTYKKPSNNQLQTGQKVSSLACTM